MSNRENRRNTKKQEIRLRKKIAKVFDEMTPEEQENSFANIMEVTGKAQAELRMLRMRKNNTDCLNIARKENDNDSTNS